MLMGAFEDKMVRFFDRNKMTHCFKAHEDSVTSIAATPNINEFFTCGHDGFVKLWDLRKLEPIVSFNVISIIFSRILKSTTSRCTASRPAATTRRHQAGPTPL